MNKAQAAFQKLRDSVGNVGFYLNPPEIKAIEDKLADAAEKPAKKAAKKSGKK